MRPPARRGLMDFVSSGIESDPISTFAGELAQLRRPFFSSRLARDAVPAPRRSPSVSFGLRGFAHAQGTAIECLGCSQFYSEPGPFDSLMGLGRSIHLLWLSRVALGLCRPVRYWSPLPPQIELPYSQSLCLGSSRTSVPVRMPAVQYCQ